MKSSNLRHCQAHSQNKELSEYKRRASQLQTGPYPTSSREADGRQPELERDNLSPRDHILHQTASRLQLLTKCSWDPGQLTRTRRVTARDQLPRGDTQHTSTHGTTLPLSSQETSGWDWGGDKTHHTPGESALTKHLVT